jgi:hypothetical protein
LSYSSYSSYGSYYIKPGVLDIAPIVTLSAMAWSGGGESHRGVMLSMAQVTAITTVARASWGALDRK